MAKTYPTVLMNRSFGFDMRILDDLGNIGDDFGREGVQFAWLSLLKRESDVFEVLERIHERLEDSTGWSAYVQIRNESTCG
jgi:hypothetical protein